MKAGEDIPYGYRFSVDGINCLNPVTLVDTGYRVCFEATKAYKAGDVVDGYTPRAMADGLHRNVTRAPSDSDIARLA